MNIMPLIFMAGGMLDYLGGKKLPGRCTSVSSARRKLQRLSKGDKRLANKIVESQRCILDHFSLDYCRPYWEKALVQICDNSDIQKELPDKMKTFKIAVILPAAYTGGVFDYALRFIDSLIVSSKRYGDSLQVTLCYPDEEHLNSIIAQHGLKNKGIGLDQYTAELKKPEWINASNTIQGTNNSEWKKRKEVCVLHSAALDFHYYDYVE